MDDLISRQAAIDALHMHLMYRMGTDSNKKRLDDWINGVPSAQPEQIARDIATIIENEQDMRVVLKNAEHTETHSCDYQRTETHESCTDCPLYDHDRHNCPRFNRVIPATIEAAKPRWIPVTEQETPDEDNCTRSGIQYSDYVLMTVYNKDDDETITDVGYTRNGEWYSDTTDEIIPNTWKVLAWMPLPEPYEGGQE